VIRNSKTSKIHSLCRPIVYSATGSIAQRITPWQAARLMFQGLSHRYSAILLFFVSLCGSGIVLSGCSGDTTGATAIVAPSDLYWSLRLNYHAINLALAAPYDTVRLTASAIDAAGHVIPNAGPVIFRGFDSTVTVDSTGLITAHYKTANVSLPVSVVAELTVRGVTYSDTAFIQVVTSTPARAPLKTFSVQPLPGDSAKAALSFNNVNYSQIMVFATDSTGTVLRDENVNDLLVSFVSGNDMIASIDKNGTVTPQLMVGSVYLHASTYAYGVAANDSIQFVVGYPILAFDNQIATCKRTMSGDEEVFFFPASITIGVGGRFRFRTDCNQQGGLNLQLTDTLDIIFDDTTIVPGGTLMIPVGEIRNVKIGKEGVFPFHSARYGGSGTVISSSGP